MAKFCNQCGRPLKEGEVCNCTGQQQAGNAWQQPQMNRQQPYKDSPNGPQGGFGYQQPYGGPPNGPQRGFSGGQWGPSQGDYGPQSGPGYRKQYQVPPQVTDFMAEFKLFFLRFLPFITDPIGELRNTYQRNNFSSGLYMFLADFLMMLLYLIVLCVRVSIMVKSKLNDMSYGAYDFFPEQTMTRESHISGLSLVYYCSW